MTPGILTEPERSNEWKQAYKEGYETGKQALKQELKDLARKLDDKEAFPAYSYTFSCEEK